jgi:membrane-associated protease RseP (regulator of RpoE activity)
MSGFMGILLATLVFLAMVTIIAFVHELGHFLVARRVGVRVETFAVGFGRELLGWTDSRGTRWKLGLLPLGGYVKMFAEDGRVRLPDGSLRPATPAERAETYGHRSVSARAAIVLAGPLANILFAILLLAAIGLFTGQAGPVDSLGYGAARAYAFAADNLSTLAGLVSGDTAAGEVLGPIRIAEVSGRSAATYGVLAVALLTALISVNIGIINLLPIPVLDGGHLVFLAVEACRGRPLGPRLQRISVLCGLTAVLGLSLAATLNDVVRLAFG